MRTVVFRIGALLLVASAVVAYFVFDLGQVLSFDYFAAKREALGNYYEAHPWRFIAIYGAVYIAITAASLPGAAVMTLAGGALLGLLVGTVVVSFASTIGATLAFLVARFVLGDFVRKRFGKRLKAIDEGFEREGALYLFSLRLVPIFPFFVINLLMALTRIRTVTYYVVSQIGMLPATIVYVNAGTQLAGLQKPGDILTPGLIGSFIAIGLFPLLARRITPALKRVIKLRKYPRPKRYEYDVLIIGAGSAGLVSAIVGSTVNARVALVEKKAMGGDCLNTGCVPSKALLRAAHAAQEARRAPEFGVRTGTVEVDFGAVMQHVRRAIGKIQPHDSAERYRGMGVDVFEAEAYIESPFEVEIRPATGRSRRVTTRTIVVASGATPTIPDIPGLESVDYLTSETVWDLDELPRRLAILGGGPLGCELAQAFVRLGSAVTLIQKRDQLLPKEDVEVAEVVQRRLEAEGVDVRLGLEAVRVTEEKTLVCEGAGDVAEIGFDRLLVALGRRPQTRGFGLEALGVEPGDGPTLVADAFLQTSVPNIYVCGDVAGPFQFTHAAGHQAWYATVNALFAPWVGFRVDHRVIPWVTYTDPEVGRVGLSERQARQDEVEYEVTRYDLDELDRAVTEGEASGFVKVLTPKGKDIILGAVIVGARAGELLAELVLAMKQDIGLKKVLDTVHSYPTLAEANRHAAGNWAKAHKPEWALSLLGRYFAWRRG